MFGKKRTYKKNYNSKYINNIIIIFKKKFIYKNHENIEKSSFIKIS